LVGQERLELSRPKALVPKTSVSAIPPPAHWSTDPDSKRIRAGLQSAASTASAFSAQKNYKLWLGRKDSNLRTLGSEPSAVAAVLLPNMCFGCGTRYRAELSRASTWRFHLISFPAPNRPPSSILVSGCRMSNCDGQLGGREGSRTPVEA
jgi:hypothetical protein